MPVISIAPLSEPVTDERGLLRGAWRQWVTASFRILFDLQNSGTTAHRPTAALYTGKFYFDTTLGKPIWLKSVGPTVWVDATGASV